MGDDEKIRKINSIKWWLQSFGERGNDTFYMDINVEGNMWCLSLEYHFDMYGNEYKPESWCICTSTKPNVNKLEMQTIDDLSKIVDGLRAIHIFH